MGADDPRFFTLSDSDKFLDQLYTGVWVTLQDLWLWGNSRLIYYRVENCDLPGDKQYFNNHSNCCNQGL